MNARRIKCDVETFHTNPDRGARKPHFRLLRAVDIQVYSWCYTAHTGSSCEGHAGASARPVGGAFDYILICCVDKDLRPCPQPVTLVTIHFTPIGNLLPRFAWQLAPARARRRMQRRGAGSADRPTRGQKVKYVWKHAKSTITRM